MALKFLYEQWRAPAPPETNTQSVVSIEGFSQDRDQITEKLSDKPKVTIEKPQDFAEDDQLVVLQIHKWFATGAFQKALDLADQHYVSSERSERFHNWLKGQMPVLLTSAAWMYLRLAKCDLAIPYFKRAMGLSKDESNAKGLAVCYYKQNNLIGASEYFHQYFKLAQNPEAETYLLYAEVLESESLYYRALEVLRDLEKREPKKPEVKDVLKKKIPAMRAKANQSAGQLIETSSHFQLTYTGDQHDHLITFVLETLELALDEYLENFGFQYPNSLIEVVLYPKADFKNVITGGPDWADGIFDGRLRIPIPKGVDNNAQLAQVLRHELVHALLANITDGRSLPSWFDEGVAQWLSCFPRCGPFQYPIDKGEFLQSTAFETRYTSLDAANAAKAYRQSLFLMYVLEREYGESCFRELINGLNRLSSFTTDDLLLVLNTNPLAMYQAARRHWRDKTPL